MNVYVSAQQAPPHHSMPGMNDSTYRAAAPAYSHPHTVPMPQQPQMAPYDQYPPRPAEQAPAPELPSLAPGSNTPTKAGAEKGPRSLVENGRKYELVVLQQPRRARMCGFGDKDRRPITPPPCVRLIVTDIKTGKEIDVNMFVLNVDLWNPEGDKEVNLVRHSASSPSISATNAVSFTQDHPSIVSSYSSILPSRDPQYPGSSSQYQGQSPYNPYPGHPQVNPGYAPAYTPSAFPAAPNGSSAYHPQNGYQGQAPPYYAAQQQIQQQAAAAAIPGPGTGAQASFTPQPYTPGEIGVQRINAQTNQPTGMFTRNLIGSLAASAFRLTDPDDQIRIWFVLQDLSIRTEGNFRLRFSFVNVGNPSSPTSSSAASNSLPTPHSPSSIINTGKAPVLAACFSDVFTVYSAKKFPGVVESTPLSKCFATQGIKIPIRKDGPTKGDGQYEED